MHSVYIIQSLCLFVWLDIDTYIEIKFIVSPHYLHSFYKTKYTCTLVHLYTLKKFTNYEAGYSVEVMIINIDLYLWCINAHYDDPRSFFLCVENPKVKTLIVETPKLYLL